jgi:probable lipoprotein NlpC
MVHIMTQERVTALHIKPKKSMKKRLFLSVLFLLCTTTAMNAQILSPRKPTDASPRELFIRTARTYLGTPYVSGGTGRQGMDCSGLVYRAALEGPGVDVPRTVVALSGASERIDDSAMEPGDLLFFNTTGRLSHVGIYLGGGTFIHAASDGPRTGVIISTLNEDYWKRTYVYAGRIFLQEGLKMPGTDGERAQEVNPFPFDGRLGFRLNYTGGVLWGFTPGESLTRGGAFNAEITWVRGMEAYPGVGAGFAWDARTDSFSVPLTASLSFPNGFRFFVGTQLHLTADKSLDASPKFPGIIGLSWNSKPADLFGQKVRFYQSVEYSWFPDETVGRGLRFDTGVTVSCDI